jgi:ketosteroid isomerase-like protein
MPPNNSFGSCAALAELTVVVGAPNDHAPIYGAGAAYVFEERNGAWEQVAKLLASDAQVGDKFGSSVAIDDGVIVAGAPDADPYDFASGAAYVFERDGDGTWIETAKLIASDGSPLDTFGTSVAIDGGLIVIGAFAADGVEPGQGKVYLFEKSGGQWVETAIITADDPAVADSFGFVEILGDTMLIGAKGVDGSGPGAAGAAYLFRRQPDGSWLQTAKIQPDDLGTHDNFGRAVALTEELAVIGAPLADVYGTDSGAAYVYAIGGDADGDGRPDLCQCRGDIDGSGVVDQPDLGLLLASFNLPIDHPLYNADADLDGDDDVDLADLGALLADYDLACE